MTQRATFSEKQWAHLRTIVSGAGGEVARLDLSRERLESLIRYHEDMPIFISAAAAETRARPALWAAVTAAAERLAAALDEAEANDRIEDLDKPSWVYDPRVARQEREVIARLIERSGLRGQTSTKDGNPGKRAHEALWWALTYFWENDLGLTVVTTEEAPTLYFLEAVGERVAWLDTVSRNRRNIRTALRKPGSPWEPTDAAKN